MYLHSAQRVCLCQRCVHQPVIADTYWLMFKFWKINLNSERNMNCEKMQNSVESQVLRKRNHNSKKKSLRIQKSKEKLNWEKYKIMRKKSNLEEKKSKF